MMNVFNILKHKLKCQNNSNSIQPLFNTLISVWLVLKILSIAGRLFIQAQLAGSSMD